MEQKANQTLVFTDFLLTPLVFYYHSCHALYTSRGQNNNLGQTKTNSLSTQMNRFLCNFFFLLYSYNRIYTIYFHSNVNNQRELLELIVERVFHGRSTSKFLLGVLFHDVVCSVNMCLEVYQKFINYKRKTRLSQNQKTRKNKIKQNRVLTNIIILLFVFLQILEAGRDLLKQSQEGALTSLYFYDMSTRLERLLFEVTHPLHQGLIANKT